MWEEAAMSGIDWVDDSGCSRAGCCTPPLVSLPSWQAWGKTKPVHAQPPKAERLARALLAATEDQTNPVSGAVVLVQPSGSPGKLRTILGVQQPTQQESSPHGPTAETLLELSDGTTVPLSALSHTECISLAPAHLSHLCTEACWHISSAAAGSHKAEHPFPGRKELLFTTANLWHTLWKLRNLPPSGDSQAERPAAYEEWEARAHEELRKWLTELNGWLADNWERVQQEQRAAAQVWERHQQLSLGPAAPGTPQLSSSVVQPQQVSPSVAQPLQLQQPNSEPHAGAPQVIPTSAQPQQEQQDPSQESTVEQVSFSIQPASDKPPHTSAAASQTSTPSLQAMSQGIEAAAAPPPPPPPSSQPTQGPPAQQHQHMSLDSGLHQMQPGLHVQAATVPSPAAAAAPPPQLAVPSPGSSQAEAAAPTGVSPPPPPPPPPESTQVTPGPSQHPPPATQPRTEPAVPAPPPPPALPPSAPPQVHPTPPSQTLVPAVPSEAQPAANTTTACVQVTTEVTLKLEGELVGKDTAAPAVPAPKAVSAPTPPAPDASRKRARSRSRSRSTSSSSRSARSGTTSRRGLQGMTNKDRQAARGRAYTRQRSKSRSRSRGRGRYRSRSRSRERYRRHSRSRSRSRSRGVRRYDSRRFSSRSRSRGRSRSRERGVRSSHTIRASTEGMYRRYTPVRRSPSRDRNNTRHRSRSPVKDKGAPTPEKAPVLSNPQQPPASQALVTIPPTPPQQSHNTSPAAPPPPLLLPPPQQRGPWGKNYPSDQQVRARVLCLEAAALFIDRNWGPGVPVPIDLLNTLLPLPARVIQGLSGGGNAGPYFRVWRSIHRPLNPLSESSWSHAEVCPGNWSLPVLSLPTPGTQGTTGGGTAPVLSLPLLEDALFQAPPQVLPSAASHPPGPGSDLAQGDNPTSRCWQGLYIKVPPRNYQGGLFVPEISGVVRQVHGMGGPGGTLQLVVEVREVQGSSFGPGSHLAPQVRSLAIVPAVSIILQKPEAGQQAVLLCPVTKSGHPVAAAGDDVMMMNVEKKTKLIKGKKYTLVEEPLAQVVFLPGSAGEAAGQHLAPKFVPPCWIAACDPSLRRGPASGLVQVKQEEGEVQGAPSSAVARAAS